MKPTLLSRIGGIFGDIVRANAAVRSYEQLSAMSDARLALRGLRRHDVAAAAFDAAFGKTAR